MSKLTSPTRRRSSPHARQSRESLFEHATLLEFSGVINSAYDLRFILNHILLTIMGKMLTSRGMAALLHGGATYQVELSKGFPGAWEGVELKIPRLPPEIMEKESLVSGRAPWQRTLRKGGVALVLPLWLGDQPIGFLAFGEKLTGKRPLARELSYLHSLANLSATAVQKSHTITELERVNRQLDRKVQELNTLFDLGKEFGGLLEKEKLVRLLVFSLMGQVGVSRYLVALYEHASLNVVASRVDGPIPQEKLLQGLARLKGPTLVDNMLVHDGMDPRAALEPLHLRVVIPVHLKGDARGLLLLGDKLNREPFSDGDLEFLSSLGNLAMIALENARLFNEAIEKQKMEDELLIAREIQKGLLPSVLPDLPGIEIAAANISSKQVGGDYYDVIPAEGGRYVCAIGDVSGKGTPASLLMANLQATIRALVPLPLSLSELTGRVNDLMCQNTGGNKFVTFFWGIIDPSSLTMRYVNAGHNYPFLLRADGGVERLDRGGMILGVIPTSTPYDEGEIHLGRGDRLVLFTDGISEAMSSTSEEYGEERLAALLVRCVGCDAQRIVDRIHQAVVEHARGAQQSDDITLMVLRVVGDIR